MVQCQQSGTLMIADLFPSSAYETAADPFHTWPACELPFNIHSAEQHETEAARYQMSLSYLNLISLSCTLINWSEVPINDKLVFSSDYTVCLGSSPSRHLLRIPQSGTTSNVMTLRLIWQELVHGWDLSPFEVPISMPPSHSRVTCLALENL